MEPGSRISWKNSEKMIEKAQIAFKRMLVGIWSFKPARDGSEGMRNMFLEIGNIFRGIKKV